MTERPINPPENRDRDDMADELYAEFSADPGEAIAELLHSDLTSRLFAIKTLASMCDRSSAIYSPPGEQFLSGRWIERRMREADE